VEEEEEGGEGEEEEEEGGGGGGRRRPPCKISASAEALIRFFSSKRSRNFWKKLALLAAS
jgi:hypothetical protein